MVVNRREGQQIVPIILGIAECDQTLVLTAIVPVQLMFTERQGDTIVQDALHVVDVSLFLIHLGRHEEAGRRHLFPIAHHDQRLASCYGSHSLTRWHLRSLIEDNQIKLLGIQIDELCY